MPKIKIVSVHARVRIFVEFCASFCTTVVVSQLRHISLTQCLHVTMTQCHETYRNMHFHVAVIWVKLVLYSSLFATIHLEA
jgi:hypothetical protein